MIRKAMFKLLLIMATLFCAALPGATPCLAQMQLPGATVLPPAAPGAPAGAGILPLGKKAPRKTGGASRDSSFGKPPGEEAIGERPLYQNGAAGAMEFARRDKALQIRKLVFRGEQLAKPGEACDVSVAVTGGLTATPAGTPSGLAHYDVELEACPFSFDILDDAILVSSPNLVCEFKQAGCQVSPSGLWGPPPASFTPAKAKDIERARTRWETAVRASFRDALARAKDQGEIKQAARSQAGFSSERETQCRDYAGEATYGFCAARITQARAFALRAKTGQLVAQHAAEKPGKAGKKRKRR